MKHKISANSKSVTNAGITSDYKQAIAEYIWNGFDAGASRVYIDYEANGLGALTSLSISDNGSGIKHDTIEFTFGAFLDSQKTKTFQRTSDVRGKKGKGRFSFSQFATKATWDTTYKDNEDKKKSFSITISIENLADFDVSEPTPTSDEQNTGTVVSFQNIKDLSEQHLIDASFTEYLAQQFAWFLCLNQARNYAIFLNGVELDYEYLIATKEEIPIDINSTHFDITYIQWDKKIGDKFYFYLMNSNLEENCKILTSFNNNTINFYHSVYVKSSYFNDFIFEKQPAPRLDNLKNQCDKTYKILVSKLKDILEERQKIFVKKNAANKLIAKFEQSGILPTFKNNRYDIERKKDLIETIKNIYYVQPKIFKGLKKEQEKTLVGFLNLLLDSDERERILTIIDGVVNLTEDERIQLSNVLKTTSMSKINRTINMMHNRLEVVECLKLLVYDLSTFTNERDHIQKIIENNYWLFGEQYHLVSHDESFDKVLYKYLYVLDGKNAEANEINNLEKYRRPDIFMCRKSTLQDTSHSSLIEENIIVELKRPSVEIGFIQYRQIEDYFRLIKNEPQFNSQLRNWKFIVVGKTIDKEVIERYKSFEHFNKRFLVNKVDNYEIYAMTWDDVFKSFELTHYYVLEKLDFDKNTIQQEIDKVRTDRSGVNQITQKVLSLETN